MHNLLTDQFLKKADGKQIFFHFPLKTFIGSLPIFLLPLLHQLTFSW